MARIMGFILFAFAVICLLARFTAAEELTLNINVKKPIAVVSEKFLSITLDPVALFNTDFMSDAEKSINMARALAPAYVRIAGPRSNSYVFERGLYPQETHPQPGLTFTETHWINLHQWAERSGLEVVACIAPQMSEGARAWDPRNALDLISFSDHMGYNTSWQLGYECQTNCKASGGDLGRDVARLRNMLDAFPRFAETGLIAGPDVVAWRTKQEQQYLQDYFNAAAAGLSAVTWHPDFASVSLEEDGVSMHYDNLAVEKDALYKVVGRQIAKKPLWLAESKPEDCKRQFLGALVWARRLGNSAKLGAQVLMRQPENSNLLRPTPDFWVSMLHKMLVGREVLDTKIATGNRTHVHFYAQCTRPSSKYEKGSVTIFGINLTPAKVAATLKGLKIKTVHKYVLLPGYDKPNRMFSETVLLNNDLLSLINGKEMPEINPIMYNVDKDIKLKLPSGGIGFWVLPGLKIKSCMGPEDEIADRNIVRKANKRLEDLEIEEDLEPGDADSREIPDVDSYEERRPLQRHPLPKRLPARRSVRHKEMDRDDERSFRRGEGAKRDVRRHEKFGRKNVESDEKDGNFEDAIERKASGGQSPDSGEEIRAKLHEYKRRLADYEYRKNQRELPKVPDSSLNKNMETGKVIEALTLMTKVENAMKGLERNNDTQQGLPLPPMRGSGDINDGQKKGSKSDGLLGEVLNTEKAKRTAVPTKIEDQLKALYRLLSEEKDKRDAQSPLRHRRDLDKRVGDDPLGIRRDSIFLRKRTEAKERRNERRQRIRERLEELRRERENTRKTSRDTSSENNFYGFQYRAPLKNFPEGDLYLQGTLPTAEQIARLEGALDEHDDLWLEEGDGNHMPNEFYENVKPKGGKAKENLKEYGELWEAEALGKNGDDEKNVKATAGKVAVGIVTEKPLTDAEDRKAKEQAVQQLINYYEAAPQGQAYDFEELRQQRQQEQQLQPPQVPQQQLPQMPQQQQLPQMPQQQQLPHMPQQPQIPPQHQVYYQQQMPINYQQAVAAGNKYYPDANRYYLDQYQQPGRRAKRDVNDIEDLLRQEMIDEDDNNLKDCQCRVIRGTENCKDCQIQKPRQAETPYYLPEQGVPNPVVANYGQRRRVRRDTAEVAPTTEAGQVPDEIAMIPEGAPGVPETLEVRSAVAGKTPEVEIEEAIIPEAAAEEVASIGHGAVNIQVTMESSKEDGTPAPVNLEMNLEDEDTNEPLGSRVARRTNSTAKLFRTKKKLTKTTPAPEAKDATSRPDTAVDLSGGEPSKGAERRDKMARSIGARSTEPAAGTSKSSSDVTLAGAGSANQPPNSAFTGGANPSVGTTFTGYADQSYAPFVNQAVGIESQPQITTYNQFPTKTVGFGNAAYQAPTAIFAGAANQPPTTGFVGNPNQPTTTGFVGTANHPSTSGIVSSANILYTPTFAGTVAKPAATPATEIKPSTSIGVTKTAAGKATAAVPNGQNKSPSEESSPIAKRQGTTNSETASFKQTSTDQATTSPILDKATTTKSIKTISPPQAKKPIIPPKTNSTAKIEDLIKARHARFTTRSEALAALRKENENRRAKKMIEASMKLLESESARFAEYEKRRRQQLDRLKDKLRAKREKMLHQYREELIEAISDSEDQKKRNLRRRDLLDQTDDEESGFANYSPIMEMRSLHNDANPHPGSEGEYLMGDGNSEEYEESRNAKRSMSLDHQPLDEDEELYDTSDSEFRSANFKRSPMVDYQHAKPQVMEGDSGEYYTQEEQDQLQRRVAEAQRKLQQQRQQRLALRRQQKEQEERVRQQQQAAAQQEYPYPPQGQQGYPPYAQPPYGPQAQQPYPPQAQQPYPPQAQQPYPPQAQPPYPPQAQQPYPPQAQQPYPPQAQQPYAQQPYPQGSQRNQNNPRSQRKGKNVMPLNVQYSQPPPQAPVPQYPAFPQQPERPQPDTKYPGLQPTVAPQAYAQPQPVPNCPAAQAALAQQQAQYNRPRTGRKNRVPQPSTAQEQQPYAQQPNAAFYNQEATAQPQHPGASYYSQDPAAAGQQPGAEYYNYAAVNAQQQQPSDVDYVSHQASVPQQPNVDYVNQQAPIPQQELNVDYAIQQSPVPQKQQNNIEYGNEPVPVPQQQFNVDYAIQQSPVPQKQQNNIEYGNEPVPVPQQHIPHVEYAIQSGPVPQQPNVEIQSAPVPEQPNVEYVIEPAPMPRQQQPNIKYGSQPIPVPQQQQPNVDYAMQPAPVPEQPSVEYVIQSGPMPQQQPNVDYASQQAPVPQQQQPAGKYAHPSEQQQYYYQRASTDQQRPAEDYYKQYPYAAQQPIDANNIKNSGSSPQVVGEVNRQPAVSSPPYTTSYTQGASYPVSNAQQLQAAADQYRRAPATQQRPDTTVYEARPENMENLRDLKVYKPVPTEESQAPFDPNNYYQYYRDLNQQEADVNRYEISPAAYESLQQSTAPRGCKKAKRSNLKVLEINPSIYDDDDSDYNLHELFMKPSTGFSSRSYRSSPNDAVDSKRHRRGVEVDEKEDGPLSISLGLELSDMVSKESNGAKSDASTRRKRETQEGDFQGKSSINKNIKKAYKVDEKKKAKKRLMTLKHVDDTETIPRVRKLRLVDDSINYFPSIKTFANNNLDGNKDADSLLTRRRRSPEPRQDNHVKYNSIDRNEDSDMNEIWNDIIEMKQDEALDEYDRRKDELFSSFIHDQKPDDNKESMIQKIGETTTKANIESIIVEAIPKLENVITGGIEKAQNLTGNFEDFIENFDEQFDETTENVQETAEAAPEDIKDGRLSHSVFKTMIGSVRKFFGFLTGMGKIFRKH